MRSRVDGWWLEISASGRDGSAPRRARRRQRARAQRIRPQRAAAAAAARSDADWPSGRSLSAGRPAPVATGRQWPVGANVVDDSIVLRAGAGDGEQLDLEDQVGIRRHAPRAEALGAVAALRRRHLDLTDLADVHAVDAALPAATTLPAPAVNEKAELGRPAVRARRPPVLARRVRRPEGLRRRRRRREPRARAHRRELADGERLRVRKFARVERLKGGAAARNAVPTTAFHSFATCCVSVPLELDAEQLVRLLHRARNRRRGEAEAVARWSIWDSMRRGLHGQSVVFKRSGERPRPERGLGREPRDRVVVGRHRVVPLRRPRGVSLRTGSQPLEAHHSHIIITMVEHPKFPETIPAQGLVGQGRLGGRPRPAGRPLLPADLRDRSRGARALLVQGRAEPVRRRSSASTRSR